MCTAVEEGEEHGDTTEKEDDGPTEDEGEGQRGLRTRKGTMNAARGRGQGRRPRKGTRSTTKKGTRGAAEEEDEGHNGDEVRNTPEDGHEEHHRGQRTTLGGGPNSTAKDEKNATERADPHHRGWR